jgi:polysaccharide biosynthesis/export protein
MPLLCWTPPGQLKLTWIGLVSCSLLSTVPAIAQTQPAQAGQQTTGEAKPAEVKGGEADTSATRPNSTPNQTSAAVALDSTLRLGAGDLVEISVYNVPELATKARISESGDLYLPLIDYVHVAGLTADEAQEVIEKKLEAGGFVKGPHVSVFVDQYASQGASVLGEISRPGVYPVMGQQRLFDLISQAGGLTERSGRSATITHRNQPDKPVVVPLSKNLADNPGSNIEVFPGDTVIVRPADIVYVVGDVARPTGLLIDRGTLTVMQALALAGGTTRTSRPNGARIIHKSPSGMTETHVQLKKILQAKAADVTLSPDDILFVPSSAFKTVVQDNASLAMQVTSLSLVVVR